METTSTSAIIDNDIPMEMGTQEDGPNSAAGMEMNNKEDEPISAGGKTWAEQVDSATTSDAPAPVLLPSDSTGAGRGLATRPAPIPMPRGSPPRPTTDNNRPSTSKTPSNNGTTPARAASKPASSIGVQQQRAYNKHYHTSANLTGAVRTRTGGAKTHYMKRTVCVADRGFTHREIISAFADEVGPDTILGLVKSNGEWQVTVTANVNIEDVILSGIGINGHDVYVRPVAKNIITVSFFGVPYFIGNDELSSKLFYFGVKQVSPWIRKCYDDYPDIQNGIVHCRVQLPDHITSLPYATRIGEVNMQIKHNGQHKVCNNCLSEDHLMRSCPQKKLCSFCGIRGHLADVCPDKQDELSSSDSDSAVSEDGRQYSDDARDSVSLNSESLDSSLELVIDETAELASDGGAKRGADQPRKRGEEPPRNRGEDMRIKKQDQPRKRGEELPRNRGEDVTRTQQDQQRKRGEDRGKDSPRKRGEEQPRKSGEDRGKDLARTHGEDQPRKSGEDRGEDSPRKRGEDSPQKSEDSPMIIPETQLDPPNSAKRARQSTTTDEENPLPNEWKEQGKPRKKRTSSSDWPPKELQVSNMFDILMEKDDNDM
jgi:hypothetical protein